MKKGKNRPVSLILILVMVLTMVMGAGSVSYAAAPEILTEPSNVWLWPGEGCTIGIGLSSGADMVHLEAYDWEYKSWYTCATCSYQDPGKTMWYYDVTYDYFEGPRAGGDFVRLRYSITYDDGTKTMNSLDFNIAWDTDQGYERLAGANRYETALAVAEAYRGLTSGLHYNNVIIASGLDFADALGGTYLAAKTAAPILLVNRDPKTIKMIAENVKDYLSASGKVFILGGTGAVSPLMEEELNALGIPGDRIKRFGGKNRYDTNLQILEYCSPVAEDVLVCCGTNFADALSASATGKPILLVGKTLTEDQLSFFNHSVPARAFIIGGEGAVSASIEQLLKDFGLPEVYRVWGPNRYVTSAMVAAEFFTDKQRYYVTLAYGQNFPDGLSGGPLSYAIGAPLLLVRDGNEQDACDVVKNGIRSRRAKVLGGPSLISNALVEKILDVKGAG